MNNFLNKIPHNITEPYSWVGHVFFAQELVCELKPGIFVELGTHSGNSYFSVCQSVKANNLKTKCFAIDTWKGDRHASFYKISVFNRVKKINEKYSDFSSLLKKTFDEGLKEFNNESIDLLHIDGLHTYDAVSKDFFTWLPKLKKNAVILFHDTNVKHGDFGVYKFWNEIKKKYALTFEFLHSNGLGILQLGKKSDDNVLSFFKTNKKQQKIFLDSYEFIGSIYYDVFCKENNINDLKQIIKKNNTLINQLSDEKNQLSDEKDQVTQELTRLYNTKTFKYSRFFRNLYKKLRTLFVKG